jgi:hypothetical protein
MNEKMRLEKIGLLTVAMAGIVIVAFLMGKNIGRENESMLQKTPVTPVVVTEKVTQINDGKRADDRFYKSRFVSERPAIDVSSETSTINTEKWNTYYFKDDILLKKIEFKIPVKYKLDESVQGILESDGTIRLPSTRMDSGELIFWAPSYCDRSVGGDCTDGSYSLQLQLNYNKIATDEWIDTVYAASEPLESYGKLITNFNPGIYYARQMSIGELDDYFIPISDDVILRVEDKVSGSSTLLNKDDYSDGKNDLKENELLGILQSIKVK